MAYSHPSSMRPRSPISHRVLTASPLCALPFSTKGSGHRGLCTGASGYTIIGTANRHQIQLKSGTAAQGSRLREATRKPRTNISTERGNRQCRCHLPARHHVVRCTRWQRKCCSSCDHPPTPPGRECLAMNRQGAPMAPKSLFKALLFVCLVSQYLLQSNKL
jgi:hypothetical protein